MNANIKTRIAAFVMTTLILNFGIISLFTTVLVRAAPAHQNVLQYGQGINGAFDAAHQNADHLFTGKTGDKVTIEMNALVGDVDPVVALYDPQGRLIGEDDNGGGKDNARLSGLVLPVDGSYRIAGTNKRKGSQGKYSLVVNVATAQGKVIYYHGDQSKEAFQLSRPWQHTNITYRIRNTQPGFTAENVKATIRQAFQDWANVTPLAFQEVSGNSKADLDIQFAPIDGALNILGETCPPSSPCAGQIKFDSEESWTMGAANGYQNISFQAVATHEFGHAIGLLHSSDSSALMYPSYSPYHLKPNPDDIRGAQALYGPGRGSVSNPTSIPNGPEMNPNNTGQTEVRGTISDNRYVAFWDFDVDAGETVTITMKRASGNLDSLVVLLDANNRILAYDDDGGGNRDAVLRNAKLPQRGTYSVAVTRYQQAQGYTSGDYLLSIQYGVTNAPNAPQATVGANTQPNQPAGGQDGNAFGNVRARTGQQNDLQQLPTLETLLDAPFNDSISPTTQTRNAAVQNNQPYVWPIIWCANDANTLSKNLQNIAASFSINNQPVPQNLVTQTQDKGQNGLVCTKWFVVLSDWSPGQVMLASTLTLRAPIFDGTTIYGQGDYVYKINVQIR